MIRRITENWFWKLLALTISIMLWMWLVGDEELTTTISVPVQYRNIPSDWIISSDVVDTVRLQLRGPSTKLNRLVRDNLSVQLNLGEQGKVGERTFTIRGEDLDLPPGVRFDRAMPSRIRLKLEYRISRQVPVDVRFASPPPLGYSVESVRVEPARVWITGPESRVRVVDSVETDALNLQEISGAGEAKFSAGLFVEDSHISIRDVDQVTVWVKLAAENAGGR